ncbi:hypothetical protein Tco_0091996 [Tanacetum coccineum]
MLHRWCLGREPELEVEDRLEFTILIVAIVPDNYDMSGQPPAATSGDTPEVEALVLTLATMALLRELRTLDLLSMMLEQSAGLLSKKLPPAAEFKKLIITFKGIENVSSWWSSENPVWTCSEKIF